MKKRFLVLLIVNALLMILTIIGLLQAIFTEEKYYLLFVIALMFYLITILFLLIIFYQYTNLYPLNDMKENIIKKSDLDEEKLDIKVIEQENLFLIKVNDQEYQINLTNYLFKKSYILALISRNFRYFEINNKKPLKYLFTKKLKTESLKKLKECNVLFFSYDKLIKKVNIIKEKVIHHSYLVSLINQSRYYPYFIGKRIFSLEIRKDIYKINEKIYQEKGLIKK